MRLAVFTCRFPSRVSTFFARDMRGLIAAGVEIEVFSLRPLDSTLWRYVPAILDEGVLPRDRVHHHGLVSAIRRSRIIVRTDARRLVRVAASVGLAGISRGPVALAKSGYSLLKACAWAAECCGHFDHVLAYWGNYATTCAIAFQQLTDPTVPVTMFLHRYDLYHQSIFMRSKLLYVDNVIVVCDFNRRFIQERYPDIYDQVSPKVHRYHPALDIGGMPCIEEDRPPASLLAVGKLRKGKGFDDLLRAGALLRNRGWNVQIELVGDGPERQALARLARRLEIETAVRFRGWLPFDEVQLAMTKATILVHPSAPLGDAVPTVIKEAMAVGTPVVASAVAGIPELLDEGRCGVLVPPRSPEGLAGAIAELLGDETRLKQLARAAREFAEKNFNLWRNGLRLADILLSTPPRRSAA
jgi:glycosyltransferase involved in cell wall biosynthesis